MSRRAEALLVFGASVIAGLGVAMVGFANGTWLDAQVAVTFGAFALAFGGMHIAIRLWAPRAHPLLLPIAAFLAALGFTEVYRVDPDLAALQRWSLLFAAGLGVATLFVLRNQGVAVLRRYRYLFLTAAVALLLLPCFQRRGPFTAPWSTDRGSGCVSICLHDRLLSFQPGEVAKVFLTIFLAVLPRRPF